MKWDTGRGVDRREVAVVKLEEARRDGPGPGSFGPVRQQGSSSSPRPSSSVITGPSRGSLPGPQMHSGNERTGRGRGLCGEMRRDLTAVVDSGGREVGVENEHGTL